MGGAQTCLYIREGYSIANDNAYITPWADRPMSGLVCSTVQYSVQWLR